MLKSRTTFTGNSTKTKTNNKTFVCILLICDLKIVDLSKWERSDSNAQSMQEGFYRPHGYQLPVTLPNDLVKNPSFLI